MKKLLKYSHAAAMGYALDRFYELEELKKDLDLDTIKVVFTPFNFEWDVTKPVVKEVPNPNKKTEDKVQTKSE